MFLLVTTYNGNVHLLNLPEPFNPVKKEEPAQPASADIVRTPVQETSVSNFLKPEIENIPHKDLNFKDLLRKTIKNKELPKTFVDPFEHKVEAADEEPVPEKDPKAKKGAKEVAKEPEEPEVKEEPERGPKLDYKLGKPKKDGDLGDAGYLCRNKGPIPHTYFVRSLF